MNIIFKDCDKQHLADAKLCPRPDVFPTTPNIINNNEEPTVKSKTNNDSSHASSVKQKSENSGTGFLTILSSILALVFVSVCWVFYAYTHPHTSSGQLLIQYRPNNWSWRRGYNARYTAASIHM